MSDCHITSCPNRPAWWRKGKLDLAAVVMQEDA
jgi:hypothetical protein